MRWDSAVTLSYPIRRRGLSPLPVLESSRSGGAIRRRTGMNLQALGYVGIRTRKLEDWDAYASRFLGLQRVDKSRKALAFRMDDRKQRVVVEADEGEGPAFYGWEVDHAAALDALAAHLEKNGVS